MGTSMNWHNRDGWMRWRQLPEDKRIIEEAKTAEAIGTLLGAGGPFPDWPVVMQVPNPRPYEDPAEVPYNHCEIALEIALTSRGDSMLTRWLAALPRAFARVAWQERRFLRGDASMPRPFEPDRYHFRADEHARVLSRLAAPLVLVREVGEAGEDGEATVTFRLAHRLPVSA